MEITHTAVIDAPAERIWDLTLDLEALPSVTPTVTGVERLDHGPVRVGSRARLTQPGQPARIWTVEVVDAPHRFVWTTHVLGVRMAGVHEVTAMGADACQLRLRIVLEGRGAALLGRVGARSLAKTLATEAAGFARAATTTPA